MLVSYVKYVLVMVLFIVVSIVEVSRAGIEFDGVDDYVNLGASTVYDYTNTTFSVSLWFKASAAGYIVAKRGGGAGSGGWFFRIDAGGTGLARIICQEQDQVCSQKVTTDATLLNGAWRHLAMVMTTDTVTIANNEISIYIDGSLNEGGETETGVTGYGPATGVALHAGALSDLTGDFLTGEVDDIRVYGFALNAAQAQRLASARIKYGGVITGALSAYIPMNDCAESASGDAVTFVNRGVGGQGNAVGNDGANNTGLTCHGSVRLSYPEAGD